MNPNVEQPDERKSKIFHSVIEKLLHVVKRMRSDIEAGVSFLMRWVLKSDMDDWVKLIRVLGFKKCEIKDKRVIKFIDTSHTAHDKIYSPIRGIISLGLGIILGKSAIEKLNARST